MSNSGKEACLLGRDELNLAEFPITLIAERVPKNCKTLTFEGQHGRLTITGSDDLGLPAAPDADVIVGLIQLTKQANDFTDPKVSFTRYELLKLIGWPDQGRQYRRLDESLRRWVGVTLRWDKSWWSNSIKCRVDANFHILDNVVILDREVRQTLMARGQRTLPFSMFKWNEVIFSSFQDDNVKRINLDTYFSLRSAISKQLYRFLDKRFYVRSDWTFDLRQLACGHVGLSPKYAIGNIKQKLRPAIEELEAVDFLNPMLYGERFSKAGRGEWRIRLVHKLPPTPIEAKPQPTDLERQLIERGVTRSVVAELVATHPEERIKAQLEAVDWLREKQPGKVKDIGAYLANAIRDDYGLPMGIVKGREKQAQRAAEEAKARAAAAEKAREREEQARVDAYWDGMTEEQRAKLDAAALASADPITRANCESGPPMIRRVSLKLARESYIRGLLDLPTAG